MWWLRWAGETDDHYYRRVYSRTSGETDAEYFNRILRRFPGESQEAYKARVQSLRTVFVNAPWSSVEYDENKKEFTCDRKAAVTGDIRNIYVNGKTVRTQFDLGGTTYSMSTPLQWVYLKRTDCNCLTKF